MAGSPRNPQDLVGGRMARVRKIPQRSCVVCGRVRPKRDLIRVVRTSAGDVLVDATGKVSGRGAYVCPDSDCASRGLREGQLRRALEVPMPEAVAQALARVANLAAGPR